MTQANVEDIADKIRDMSTAEKFKFVARLLEQYEETNGKRFLAMAESVTNQAITELAKMAYREGI